MRAINIDDTVVTIAISNRRDLPPQQEHTFFEENSLAARGPVEPFVHDGRRTSGHTIVEVSTEENNSRQPYDFHRVVQMPEGIGIQISSTELVKRIISDIQDIVLKQFPDTPVKAQENVKNRCEKYLNTVLAKMDNYAHLNHKDWGHVIGGIIGFVLGCYFASGVGSTASSWFILGTVPVTSRSLQQFLSGMVPFLSGGVFSNLLSNMGVSIDKAFSDKTLLSICVDTLKEKCS